MGQLALADLQRAAESRWRAHWMTGPSRRRWNELPLQVGDPAPDFTLPDADGEPRSLSEYWAGQPALLLFWRHFGCGCGVGRAKRLEAEYPRLVEAGARIAIIGQGEPERAAWYQDRFSIPGTLLVDPDEHVYRAYGLLELSPWLLLGHSIPEPAYFDDIIVKHREMDRPVADNPFLLPGEFVVDPTGRLVLTYRYQYCDNYPETEVLVDAIAEARHTPG